MLCSIPSVLVFPEGSNGDKNSCRIFDSCAQDQCTMLMQFKPGVMASLSVSTLRSNMFSYHTHSRLFVCIMMNTVNFADCKYWPMLYKECSSRYKHVKWSEYIAHWVHKQGMQRYCFYSEKQHKRPFFIIFLVSRVQIILMEKKWKVIFVCRFFSWSSNTHCYNSRLRFMGGLPLKQFEGIQVV